MFTRTLLELDDQSLAFLLETSNRSSLSVRQGCAVESCIKQSRRFCLLLVESPLLNVCDPKVSLYSFLVDIMVASSCRSQCYSASQTFLSSTSTSLSSPPTLLSPKCSKTAGWKVPAVRQSTTATSSGWQFSTGGFRQHNYGFDALFDKFML